MQAQHYRRLVSAIVFVIVVVQILAVSLFYSERTRANPSDELNNVQLLLQDGKTDDALKRINAYLRAHPGDPSGRFLKGVILKSMHLNTEAIEVYRSLAQDMPNHPEPLNNLAVLYAETGDYASAAETLWRLIRNVEPNYAAAYENLGDVYAAWATRLYERAMALGADSANLDRKRNYLSRFTRPTRPNAQPHLSSTDNIDPDQENRDAVSALVQEWAAAWSAQDVSRYVDFYASNYTPKGFASHEEWARSRQTKIRRPKTIQVRVDDLDLETVSLTRVKTRLRQQYRSDLLRSSTEKTLTWEKTDGEWKIIHERVHRKAQ